MILPAEVGFSVGAVVDGDVAADGDCEALTDKLAVAGTWEDRGDSAGRYLLHCP